MIAAQAFKEVMGIPDKAIPQDLLDKAQCVIIVPDLKKAAFLVGGKYGKGFVSCRKKDGVGWSAPGAIRIEGGSVGFQIGGSEMDVFMLVMNQEAWIACFRRQFTLGGDATVAAGPVGRSTQAETDARMTAEILAWSRARGLFAGIALNGATLREDEDWNRHVRARHQESRDHDRDGSRTQRGRGSVDANSTVTPAASSRRADSDWSHRRTSTTRPAARPDRRGVLRGRDRLVNNLEHELRRLRRKSADAGGPSKSGAAAGA